MEKLLSIIIPLYNSAQWVEKCLDSVLNQDVPMEQMEIICVNDGSPDNSAEIVRGKSEEVRSKNGYSPIEVLDQENQGPSGARNNGMRHATGKYLMFVDPDDYVEPNTFGGLIAQMEREQLDMLRFNFRRVDEQNNELPILEEDALFDYTPEQMTGAEFMVRRLGIGCNIWRYIYRLEIITKNEIWCYTGDYFDDTPWLPLVLQKTKRMNCVDTIVYDYLERADGLVKAQSEKAIQRKIDGHILLQRYLRDGMENSSDNGVQVWYKNMIAFSAMKLLTLVAEYKYGDRRQYLDELNGLHVFPMSVLRMTKKSARKVRLLNVSPNLYMFLINLRSKII